jgi:hypothetical protein
MISATRSPRFAAFLCVALVAWNSPAQAEVRVHRVKIGIRRNDIDVVRLGVPAVAAHDPSGRRGSRALAALTTFHVLSPYAQPISSTTSAIASRR